LLVHTTDKQPQQHALPSGWRSRLVGCFLDCRRRSVGSDPRHGRIMAAMVVAPTTCAVQEAFKGASKMNLFTSDRASSAFRDVQHPVIQGNYSVLHTMGEYARSVQVVNSCLDGSMRLATAGTQSIDEAWCYIKRYSKKECSRKMLDAEAGRQMLAMRIRLGQWHYMIGGAEVFVKFAEAVEGYMLEVGRGVVTDAIILAGVEGNQRLPAAWGGV
jgi:hypothetical protein